MSREKVGLIVAQVQRLLMLPELDQRVLELGRQIATRAGWHVIENPLRRVGSGIATPEDADQVLAECNSVKQQILNVELEIRRIQDLFQAVHSDGQNVRDTFDLFGRERCCLGSCKKKRIDERNLIKCTKLDIFEAAVVSLDTRYLANLIELQADGSKLASLDTTTLASLKRLHLSRTPIRSLQTRQLINLEKLSLAQTKISALNTESLTSLQVLNLNDTCLTSLDTRPLAQLQQLCLSCTGVRALNTIKLGCLRVLEMNDSAVGGIDARHLPELEVMLLENCPIAYIQTRCLYSLKKCNIRGTRVGRFCFLPGWNLGMLYVNSRRITFMDLRGKCFVESTNANPGQRIVQGGRV